MSILFEPIRRVTATEEVAQRLIMLINSSVLKPGDRLPAERDLASQLGVGRTTVREALKVLTLSGLLESHRGRGTFVREDFFSFVASQMEWPVLLSVQDVDQIFEVRKALDVMAARLAAERATDDEIQAIAVYAEMSRKGVRDIEQEAETDLAFHRAIAVGSHNPLLLRLMLSLRSLLREYIVLSIKMTSDMRSTIEEHEAVFHAIRGRQPERAAAAMERHLSISRSLVIDAASRLKSGDQSHS